MKLTMLCTALCTLASAQVPPSAIQVGKSVKDGAFYYVSTDKIQKHAFGHLIRVYAVQQQPKAVDDGPDKGQTYDYSEMKWVVSCPDRKYVIAQVDARKRDGALVSTGQTEKFLHPAQPGSVAEAVVDAACMHLSLRP